MTTRRSLFKMLAGACAAALVPLQKLMAREPEAALPTVFMGVDPGGEEMHVAWLCECTSTNPVTYTIEWRDVNGNVIYTGTARRVEWAVCGP